MGHNLFETVRMVPEAIELCDAPLSTFFGRLSDFRMAVYGFDHQLSLRPTPLLIALEAYSMAGLLECSVGMMAKVIRAGGLMRFPLIGFDVAW